MEYTECLNAQHHPTKWEIVFRIKSLHNLALEPFMNGAFLVSQVKLDWGVSATFLNGNWVLSHNFFLSLDAFPIKNWHASENRITAAGRHHEMSSSQMTANTKVCLWIWNERGGRLFRLRLCIYLFVYHHKRFCVQRWKLRDNAHSVP